MMKPETILDGLESLSKAKLSRAPTKFGDMAEFWLQKFNNMPDNQFIYAVDKIIESENSWPSISAILRYASAWSEPKRKKDVCPYCENTGFLLIKSKGKFIAYACNCPSGMAKRENTQIASYESLGIPWPESIEKPNFSKKMSKENRRLIDTFLGRIGGEMPEVMKAESVENEALWQMMGDGSLEN